MNPDRRRQIGTNIKHLMVERRHTQSELARATDQNTSNVSRWVNGLISPPIDWLIEVAGLYRVSLDELVGHKTGEKPFDSRVHEAADFILSVRDALKRGP